MPYKVYKLTPDNRNNTCGFFMPNGFYHVLEMTFENHRQLSNISQRPGYSVDYVEGPCGMFDESGVMVEESSVQENYDPKSKIVMTYQPVTKTSTYRGKKTEKPITAEHRSSERETVVNQCRLAGIHGIGSTVVMKELLSKKKRRRQDTLVVS